MGKYIYRYISFATLVDMVQTQSLNFVLPTVWEDKMENFYLKKWIESIKNDTERTVILMAMLRTYAQSWSQIEESDAMWRIYNYENQSLRIKIDVSNIEKLENVSYEPVIYNDEAIIYNQEELNLKEIYHKLIAQKRLAFRHEEEIRLIYTDKIPEDKIPSIFGSLMITEKTLNGDNDVNIFQYNINDIAGDLEFANLYQSKKCHPVSFQHIPNFIKGIMVNPFASDWYVNTVETYCKLNNLPFEGRSELYKEVDA